MAQPALQTRTNPAPSTWISANAGSGKTTALVNRVLTLLLNGVTPERICCITYTKAAAGEMRDRILSALRALLVLPDEACREYMLKRTGAVHDLTLARSLFARVLDSPMGGLELTTIHGFCQQILRRFPLEAGLSPQFTVLEETESDNLQRIARQKLLEHAGGELAEALALIADRGGEHGFTELLRHASRKAALWRLNHENYPLPELLKAAFYEQHGIDPMETEEAVRRACVIPESLAEMTLEELYPVIFTQKGERRKKLAEHIPASFADQYERMLTHCRSIACAEESYAAAIISRAFVAEYEAIKTEYQALDYDDLILRTEQLLKEYGGWVMSRLDHRIDHLLIDEAQDTSPGQWRIARTLVEELMATAGGIGSGNIPRSLLVVGDEKQSIFSFQGADPKQFFSEKGAFERLLLETGFQTDALEKSYRSAKSVLQLVDAVAALPPVARALSAGGMPTEHILTQKEAAGRVVLHPPGDKKVKQEIEPFTIPTEYLISQTPAQLLATRIAGEIRQWLDAGKWGAGDILILLWRRQPFADCLIRALERENIPVAGIDRLKLAEHLAVRDLMALMAWTGYPGDDLALAHVLRSPVIGIGEQELEDVAFGRTGTLWQALQKTPSPPAGEGWGEGAVDVAMPQPNFTPPPPSLLPQGEEEVTRFLRELLHRRAESPYSFLTHVLETSGARVRFAARFGEEVHEVLDELKAQAASMPRSMAQTVGAFHDWITRSEREIKREQETKPKTVRIMTVHGAKGLESPVVLLVNPIKKPDTGRELGLCGTDEALPLIGFSEDGKRAAAYLDAKANRRRALFDEYYRLLYVALTRAKNELHVFAAEPMPQKEDEDKSWYSLVADAMVKLPTQDVAGTKVLENPGSVTRSAVMEQTEQPLPEWASTAPPAAQKMARVLSPSRLLDSAQSYGMATQPGANIRGVRIHRVLQFLDASSDRARIAQLLKLADPNGGEDEIEEIARLHAQERWLWEYPSYPEVNLGGTIEGQRYGGQVDRLVMTPDAVVIVDYKTGAHIPASAAEVPESYRLQLKIYRELLRQLYPGRVIRAALLWTAAPSLMWLDAELDATALPNLNNNLRQTA